MARKTILTLALAGMTALTAIPVLAQDRPAAPDCAADPAACQALVDRMGPGMDRGMDRRDGNDGDRREWRRGGDDDDHRGKRETRDWRHGGDDSDSWHTGMLQRFDSDGDGTVSAEEASAGVTALVTQFDTDADQALTIEEFGALHAELMKPMTARAFGKIDNNADGRIDAAEAQAVAQRMVEGRKAPRAPAAAAPAPAGDAAATPAAPADGAAPEAPAAAPAN